MSSLLTMAVISVNSLYKTKGVLKGQLIVFKQRFPHIELLPFDKVITVISGGLFMLIRGKVVIHMYVNESAVDKLDSASRSRLKLHFEKVQLEHYHQNIVEFLTMNNFEQKPDGSYVRDVDMYIFSCTFYYLCIK